MSQYIGKTISLTSNKGIRYVGILDDINGEDATVSLRQVRAFGTEGRKGNPLLEIPASPAVFECVVFRGNDVQDLSVLDSPPEEWLATQDPAIIESSIQQNPVPQQQQQKPYPPTPTNYHQNQQRAQPQTFAAPVPVVPQPTQQQAPVVAPQPTQATEEPKKPEYLHSANEYQHQQQQQKQQQQRKPRYNNTNNQHQSHVSHRSQASVIPKTDFDFESANSKFHKEDLIKEVEHEQGETPTIPQNNEKDINEDVIIPPHDQFYDKKSSFFDNISSGVKDRFEGNKHHDGLKWDEEKLLNLETFGQTRVPGRGNGRGRGFRGGYRGRGGRGRGYRGRGSGKFNNNNNNNNNNNQGSAQSS